MILKPLDEESLIELVAGWLSEERNYKWLDPGYGVVAPGPVALKIMSLKEVNHIRAFTADDDETPIGVVGLTEVSRRFGTATLWVAMGEKRYSMKGYVARAVVKLLDDAFYELKLKSVDVWAVSCNHASLKIIKQLNFKPVGVRRQSHVIDGRTYDRLLFDMLACEHQGNVQ